MKKSVIGYILSIVGLIGITYSVGNITEIIPIPLLSTIPSLYLTIGGTILVIAGITIILLETKSNKQKEIPIYKGKEVVGYRIQD